MAVGLVADDRDLELARAREVALDERDVVEAERLVERGGALAGVVGERHPDRAAEAGRLDHQPRVADAGREGLELGEDAVAVARPARRADLAPVDDRQPEAAHEALEQRLVHPDRATPRRPSPVYARPAASSSAWTVPSSPNGPWRAMNTTGGGSRAGEPVERLAARERALGAERRRVVVGGRRPAVAPMAVGQPPPAAVEVDEPALDGVAARRRARRRSRCRRRSRRRAPPTGRRSTTTTGVAAGRGRAAGVGRQRPSSVQPDQSPRNTTSCTSSTPNALARPRRGPVAEAADVGRRPLLVVDDEVRVLLGHARAADPGALEAGLVDQRAGRVAVGGLRKTRAGRRHAERLVRLAPAADLVEARP